MAPNHPACPVAFHVHASDVRTASSRRFCTDPVRALCVVMNLLALHTVADGSTMVAP